MARPKLNNGEKKERLVLYVLPSYVPIIKQIVEDLDKSGAGELLKQPVDNNIKPNVDGVIKKEKFGSDYNELLKQQEKEIVNIEAVDEKQVDYTLWQLDPTMIEVDRAVSWAWANFSDMGNQCPPDEGFEVLRRYPKYGSPLSEYKRNGKTLKYNELMTELYERIKK